MPKEITSRTPSKSVEDFVKAVYILQQKSDRVATNALSEALNISAPSVTDMAQRLVDAGLIDYQKYYGVRVTEDGEAIALKIIRRHRLIELYLVQELNYALHEVHNEAEALEHTVSDQFIEAIAKKMGHPDLDPHGDPIPTAEGTIVRRNLHPLSELPLNTPARISRILSSNADMVQHTTDRGLLLDTRVEVLARDPFEGPVTVKLNDKEIIIGHNVAASILVDHDT